MVKKKKKDWRAAFVIGAWCGLKGSEGMCGTSVAYAVWHQRLRTYRRCNGVSPRGYSAKSPSARGSGCLRAIWGLWSDCPCSWAPQVELWFYYSTFLNSTFRSIKNQRIKSFFPFSRFFYKHIWRQWDEEDEDDDFDYFVRCVEPRLRL